MPIPFWISGVSVGNGIDCLLPDIAQGLPDSMIWQVVFMAGKRVPGLAQVKFKRGHRVDKRTASGMAGQSMVALGYNPSEINIKITLWTPQQWIDFQTVTVPSVQPHPGKANALPKSVEVRHPSLGVWGAKQFFVLNVEGPVKGSVNGTMEITFDCSDTSPLTSAPVNKPAGAGLASAPNSFTSQSTKPPGVPPSVANNNPNQGI